jgi:uncharacterized DUF497 family protein
MLFDWAPWKAGSNERKHGLPFQFGVRVFEDSLHVDIDASRDEDGEHRRKAIGAIGGKLYSVVYTIRDPVSWIISVRRTNPKEDRLYANLRS